MGSFCNMTLRRLNQGKSMRSRSTWQQSEALFPKTKTKHQCTSKQKSVKNRTLGNSRTNVTKYMFVITYTNQ